MQNLKGFGLQNKIYANLVLPVKRFSNHNKFNYGDLCFASEIRCLVDTLLHNIELVALFIVIFCNI